jgi:hypothetical protein
MESLLVERQEMVTTLMATTGIEDVDLAREFLQENGWQLELFCESDNHVPRGLSLSVL